VGFPLYIFPVQYKPSSSNIYELVNIGMKDIWDDNIASTFENRISLHISNSASVNESRVIYNLSDAEIGAIVYYTTDARQCNGTKEQSLFYVLNRLLASRNNSELEKWKPYLFYLTEALAKLPNVEMQVYRACDKPLTQLSKNYKVGCTVVWTAFTSTSKDKDVLKQFSKTVEHGTWATLEVKEGKDISHFSLFPEEEILLLPNTTFFVSEVLGENNRRLMGYSQNMDVMYLVQLPTPSEMSLLRMKI